jgi:nucleotide-binding universal stress UspA family protein
MLRALKTPGGWASDAEIIPLVAKPPSGPAPSVVRQTPAEAEGLHASPWPALKEGHVQRILLPTDFSPGAEGALGLAVALTQGWAAALTILHVIDISQPSKVGTAADLMGNLWAEGSARMKQLAETLRGRAAARIVLKEGLPWEVIVEQSAKHDVLILGRNRIRAHWRPFTPQVGEQVIKNAACPVVQVCA